MNSSKSPSQPSKVVIQARIPLALHEQCRRLAKAHHGDNLADFVTAALENEVSRRTLCRPEKEVSLADVMARLEQILNVTGQSKTLEKLNAARLEAVAQAIGIA